MTKADYGLYPEAAKAVAQENIDQVRVGQLVTISTVPELADYREHWIVIDPQRLVMLDNGLALMPDSYDLPPEIIEGVASDNTDPMEVLEQYFQYRRRKKKK